MRFHPQVCKERSESARILADRRYNIRTVKNKKKYSRKGRTSSTR